MKSNYDNELDRKRIKYCAAGFIFFLFGYYLASIIGTLSGPSIIQESWIDQSIKFISWSILIYFSYYIFLFFGYLTLPGVGLPQLWISLWMSSIIAWTYFIAFPTSLPRPGTDMMGPWESLYRLLYYFDLPTNCTPSLHCCFALLISLAHFQKKSKHHVLIMVWCLSIMISTMSTKQHYAIDVATGILLALVCWPVTGIICQKLKERKMWPYTNQ